MLEAQSKSLPLHDRFSTRSTAFLMGYFSLSEFRLIAGRGGFWLSRLTIDAEVLVIVAVDAL